MKPSLYEEVYTGLRAVIMFEYNKSWKEREKQWCFLPLNLLSTRVFEERRGVHFSLDVYTRPNCQSTGKRNLTRSSKATIGDYLLSITDKRNKIFCIVSFSIRNFFFDPHHNKVTENIAMFFAPCCNMIKQVKFSIYQYAINFFINTILVFLLNVTFKIRFRNQELSQKHLFCALEHRIISLLLST